MKDTGTEKCLESFIIIDNDKKTNDIIINNPINNNNLFNIESSTVESIYLPLSKKIKEVPYKDSTKITVKYKRSESLSKSSSVFMSKKKDEFFLNDFEILDKNKIEPIKMFTSKCDLYDKKNNSFEGNLIIDKDYIFSFIPDKKYENKLYYNSDYYSFSLPYIKSINQNTNLLGQITYYIEIILKDCRSFLFKLPNSTYDFFIKYINKYAKPVDKSIFFEKAISYKIKLSKQLKENNNKNNKKIQEKKDYWELYDIEKEFIRQEVDFNSGKKSKYYLIDNSSFDICESYPKKIIVPNLRTKNILEDIKICADFRTKQRLPALTYKHKNGVCLWRCSQTKSGFSGKNEKDILLLTKIADGKKLMIYDCRPKLNAWANKLKGAGYENTDHYQKITVEIKFCDIPNIHAVRSSFESVFNTVSYNQGSSSQSNDFSVVSNIFSTYWYDTISLILKSSFNIWNSISKEKSTVLIHCSDGWDRTSQLSSISQILLNEYYRTLEGFIILIEKDWMSFGHQFRYRNGFYSNNDTPANICKENQFSPIFIQWLDCIYQLMEQNMDKFEFNENLLIFIAEQVYSGTYGNFLFNSEKEKEDLNIKNETESIWSYILENKKKFMSPIYRKKKDNDGNNDIPLEMNYKKIKIWEDYFFRFEKGEKKGKFFELINKKLYGYKSQILKKQKILEEMYKIIEAQNKNLITQEMKKELGIKEEEKKEEKKEFSFVVLDKEDFNDIKDIKK